jgi:hypothetical protein
MIHVGIAANQNKIQSVPSSLLHILLIKREKHFPLQAVKPYGPLLLTLSFFGSLSDSCGELDEDQGWSHTAFLCFFFRDRWGFTVNDKL